MNPSNKESRFVDEVLARKVYDLGQPFWKNMPVHPADPPFLFYYYKYHDHTVGSFGKIAPNFGDAISIIVTSMHAGTHLDTPVHMSRNSKVLGVDISKYQKDDGFHNLPDGIESIDMVSPLVLRGVLYDVARIKNVSFLPNNYEITIEDLKLAESTLGVCARKGDCALIRTGFSTFFKTDPERYIHKYPGLGADAANWLSEKKIRLVGIDNLAIGVPSTFEVHNIFLTDHGILTMKNLNLEVLSEDKCFESVVVVLPLKILGGEASLVRPIALK